MSTVLCWLLYPGAGGRGEAIVRTVTDRQTRPVLWTEGEEAAIVTTVRRVTDTAAVWEEQWPAK